MINRIDGVPFDDEDVRMLMAFNVFCGISLDNAKLYESSLDLTRQLRSFVEVLSTLNTTHTVKDVLTGILSNASAAIHAARATIHMYDVDTQSLAEFVTVGESDNYGDTFAKEVGRSWNAITTSISGPSWPSFRKHPKCWNRTRIWFKKFGGNSFNGE
jgi:hypothetical protein